MATPSNNLEKFIELQKAFSVKDKRPRVELFDSVETTKDSILGPKYVSIYSVQLKQGKYRFRDTNPDQLFYFVNKDRLKPEMVINYNVKPVVSNEGNAYFYFLNPELINEVIKNTQPEKIEILPENSTEKHFRHSIFKGQAQDDAQKTNKQLETKSNLESKHGQDLQGQELRNQNFDDAAFQRDMNKAIANSLGLLPQSSEEEDRQLKQALEASLKDTQNATTEINLNPNPADQKGFEERKSQKEKPKTSSLKLGVTFDTISSAYGTTPTLEKPKTDPESTDQKSKLENKFFDQTLKYDSVDEFVKSTNSGVFKGPYKPWQKSPYYLRPVNNPQYGDDMFALGFIFYEFLPHLESPRLGFQEILFKQTEKGFAIFEHSDKISPLTGGPYTPTDVIYGSLEEMIKGEHDISFNEGNADEITTLYSLAKQNLTIEEYIAKQNNIRRSLKP